jgi:predicted CoA-substrate-specific enzyme activase
MTKKELKQERYDLGIDIGSVSAKLVLMDPENKIIRKKYVRTKGQPVLTIYNELNELVKDVPAEKIKSTSITGSIGKLVQEYIKANFINEIVSQARSTEFYHPEVKTIIEMGGEESKLILLDVENGRTKMADFAMNTVCAAGTGSFLDQQASRLGFSIEEFGESSLKSEIPPRIAGRCSVFAKSDMIHLQQIATPDYDIIAGLCFAVARNFISTIAKGKDFIPSVSFQGGVAANNGMRRAFFEVLKLDDKDFIVPEHFEFMGAIGAILMARETGVDANGFYGTKDLHDYMNKQETRSRTSHKPLNFKPNRVLSDNGVLKPDENGKTDVFIGIDVGSLSTNVVAIDENKNLLSKRYLMTAGRPINAIKQGLKEVGEEIADRVNVKGACVTGSGRYLIGDIVGADVIVNEITAQATAAASIDSEVDTVFEIGGQDSKYISLKHGAVVDFEMNKVCAAGTGSFLEEQAEKLGIAIKKEFGDIALSSKTPSKLGERCTVFIESDLVHQQQKGAARDELVAGLCYSIVTNYLNRVVGNRKVGNKIFFQGGVAFNKGVVSAFEEVVGKPVYVPPNHEVTGAIGCGIIALLEHNKTKQKTTFKGFDISKREFNVSTFECKQCENMCEIRKIASEGEKPLFYGSRCEKYDVDRSKKKSGFPDLFAEREEMLLHDYGNEKKLPENAPKIGMPFALLSYELMPLWKTFFNKLGYRVVLSDKTNKKLIHKGVEKVLAETCFPIKVAHGHVFNLIEKGVETIFVPSIVEMWKTRKELDLNVNCPHIQAFPYTMRATIDFKKAGVKVLQPIIHFQRGEKKLAKALTDLGNELGKSQKKIKAAISHALKAQHDFKDKLKKRGEKVLSELKDNEKAVVIVSRSYNGCDGGINLDLPKKLSDLGVISMPLDFLPVDEVKLKSLKKDMYWKGGQKILAGAEIIHSNDKLYAVYITNFGCGPDSFIAHFFKERMQGKPYLQLEVDEHSADAGAITRCEAYLDSLKNHEKFKKDLEKDAKKEAKKKAPRLHIKRKVYIPYMTDNSYGISAAFEAVGTPSEVIEESDEETLVWGRRLTSGKECYPCLLTTGDMIKTCMSPGFDENNSAFFMPSGNGPCRFGQYNRFQRIILDELGFHNVPIFSPNQDVGFHEELGKYGTKFTKLAWRGIVAIDMLEKALREIRPYEINKGETQRLYDEYLINISDCVKDGGRDLSKVLIKARDEFDKIPRHDTQKPVIGLIGEIYVRTNKFSNENIINALEDLGAEVWHPPLSEWVFYTTHISGQTLREEKQFKSLLSHYITEKFQLSTEHKFAKIFNGRLKNLPDPHIKSIINLGMPYIHESFQGEAILSIGKAIDFYKKGASGIINIMPFGCMPGTIVSAILKSMREDYDNIPCLNMAYEGQENTNSATKLEAFMHQVKQFSKVNENKPTQRR